MGYEEKQPKHYRSPKGREREKGAENLFKEIIDEIFPICEEI